MPWTDKPSGGSNNSGPWGRPQGNGGGGQNGGGGNGSGGRGQGAPDLEELLRSGRERFGRGGGNGAGGGGEAFKLPSGPALLLVLLAAVALYLFTAAYTVQPGSRGVVTTFGNFTSLTSPGLNFHFPPIQSVEVVDVENDRSQSIGGSTGTSMLTSDLNIVDVSLDVNYKVKSDATWSPEGGELPNAAKFIFNIESPQLTVQAATEAALREVVGANEFGPVVSRGRAVIPERTGVILQEMLDSYESGIEIIRVSFNEATPPDPVVPAQRDVIDATSQAEQRVNEAQAYANSVIPRAEGVAFQTIQQAQAYQAQVVAQANGDSARFTSILEEYSKAPEVTRQRMYLETLESVLADMNKVLIDDNAGGALPYLNLNELARDAQRSNPSRNGGSQQ